MSTTNILDLNNRVSELAQSYPADKVIMSDGVTSVEEVFSGLVKIDTTHVNKTVQTSEIPSYFTVEDAIFDDVEGYTIISILADSDSPSSVLIGGCVPKSIYNGTNHKSIYLSYVSRYAGSMGFNITVVRVKTSLIS